MGKKKPISRLPECIFTAKEIVNDSDKAETYGCLVLKWFLRHQNPKELEILTDEVWIYHTGCGTPQDFQQAVFWFRKVAKQNKFLVPTFRVAAIKLRTKIFRNNSFCVCF